MSLVLIALSLPLWATLFILCQLKLLDIPYVYIFYKCFHSVGVVGWESFVLPFSYRFCSEGPLLLAKCWVKLYNVKIRCGNSLVVNAHVFLGINQNPEPFCSFTHTLKKKANKKQKKINQEIYLKNLRKNKTKWTIKIVKEKLNYI